MKQRQAKKPSAEAGLKAMLRVLSREIPHIVGDLSPRTLLIGNAPPAANIRGNSRQQTLRHLPPEPDVHEHAEICCVVSGKCMVRMGAQWIEAYQGDVCVFPPRTEHRDIYVSRADPYSILWIPIDSERIGGHLAKYSRSAGFNVVFHISCEAAVSSPRLARDLLRAIAKDVRRSDSILRLKACVLELCWLLFNRCLQIDAASHSNWGDKIIGEVMAYIRAHYPEGLSLPQIAGHVHLSSSYLSSLFRKHSGQTMSSYLNSLRMKKAEELLLASRLSVKQIAAQTGFRSAPYFSRCFRRLHGTAPARFREFHA
ncbi:MAG: helix-turn-helix domain-containing protein [Planctomycetota bacterium]